MSDLNFLSYFYKPFFSLISECIEWFSYSSWLLILFTCIFSISFLLPFWLFIYWIYSVRKTSISPIFYQKPISSEQTTSHIPFFPRNCVILTHFQMSMWFVHFFGIPNLLLFPIFSWRNFIFEFMVHLSPPYEYLLQKIKEPP